MRAHMKGTRVLRAHVFAVSGLAMGVCNHCGQGKWWESRVQQSQTQLAMIANTREDRKAHR
eukprot:4550167-Amphidinium_carterae.1